MLQKQAVVAYHARLAARLGNGRHRPNHNDVPTIIPEQSSMSNLNSIQVQMIVNQYIGVRNGYLGDFSYRTHGEFYPGYCDLDINPQDFPEGTTKDRFIAVIKAAPPDHQAKILRGVVERFPLLAPDAPPTRTQQLRDEMLSWAGGLEATLVVPAPTLKSSSDVVKRALSDAEALLNQADAVSAVDRAHTTLHGYVIEICKRDGITVDDNAGITALFRTLTQNHPKLIVKGVHREHVERIIMSSASIIDSVNYLRNNASMAHPNNRLLADVHAALVINVCRSLLQYMDSVLNG